MLVGEVVAAYLDGVREVCDVSRAQVDLRRHYRLPEEVAYHRGELAGAGHPSATSPDGTGAGAGRVAGAGAGAEQLLVALVGPEPSVHVLPAELAALAANRPGHRAVLLLGWPVVDLPGHLLLPPLVAARYQIVAAVPLSTAKIRGVHAALVVQRVQRPVPTRGHLGLLAPDRPAPDPTDEARTVLRMVNEHQLADLAHRPLRHRLRELEAEREADRERLRELETTAEADRRRLRELTAEVVRLRALVGAAAGDAGPGPTDAAGHQS